MASLGLDLVFIDTEHVSIGRDKLSWICGAYSARNVAPVVRIPKPDPYWACMALDGGAHGIIAPYVETAAQVQELRGAVKLRPLKGQRLYDALDGKEDLGEEVNAYLERFNRDSVLIVNIESQPALDALDDILAVPGLDALLVGPHDLSINLGVPEQYDHPKFLEAISTIIRKARAANVGAGIHFFTSIEQEIAWAKEGANLTMHSSDLVMARQSLHADLERFHRELDDAASGGSAPKIDPV
jgi:4-hydroxy-2-oxoheptanedioate aldolase